MSDTAIDLNELVPADKTVKFSGRTFVVPGDLPLSMFLAMNRISSAEDVTESDSLDQMVTLFVELFHKIPQSGVDEAESKVWLRDQLLDHGPDFIMNIMGALYPIPGTTADEPAEVDAGEAGDAVPPPEPVAAATGDGTTSTPS